jgi:hypothetical protein
MQRWRTIRKAQAIATILTALVGTAVGFGLQARANEQDSLRELAAFHLSMEKLRTAAQAGKALEKLSENDPSLKSATQFSRQRGLLSIDDSVSRIDDHPQARTAIGRTGLSIRDYVLTMYCFEQSTQALFFKGHAGEVHDLPGASRENVLFVKDHLKEINRLFSENP